MPGLHYCGVTGTGSPTWNAPPGARLTLTLILQGHIRPFRNGRMGEMHLYELPWPKDVLLDLGSAQVRLRVTLSYYIEPNPGRRGWRQRYRYPSHGLRFDVKGPWNRSTSSESG